MSEGMSGMSVKDSAVYDVVTLGEAMVVFTPTYAGSLETVATFRRGSAGAEGNVSIGLSRLGHRALWISRLGDDGFGRFLLKTLRGEGVDVTRVRIDSTRPTGIYFKEYGPGGEVRVHYYRRGSAASALSPEDVDLTGIEAQYLFVTGITPALSDSCREAVYAVIAQARERGMRVVFDPNLRFKLWESPDRVRQVVMELAGMADVVLPGVEEAAFLTGETEVEKMAAALERERTQLVVMKLGPAGAYVLEGERSYRVPGFTVQQVDEVGAGDAFAAGFLSGLIDGLAVEQAVRRACALGAMAVTVPGDYEALPDRRSMEAFLEGRAEPSR